jgi:HEAT repeat protein
VSVTPLLDFFRRGEVARDVRMLAAQGILAPRAHEQVALLILLLDDQDADVRATAARTIDRLPAEPLRAFLGRADVPAGVREFFANRGVVPAELPAATAYEPLLDA